jgi:hypothetical protein
MVTGLRIFKLLNRFARAKWLLSGWRNRWLIRIARVTCKHDGHIWHIHTKAIVYNNTKKNLGQTDSIILCGCQKCNRIIRIYDYRS